MFIIYLFRIFGYYVALFFVFAHNEVTLSESNLAPKDFTLKSGLDNVCSSAECLEKRRWSCGLQHSDCKHNCIGLMGHSCIKCLDIKCVGKNAEMNAEGFCNICWVDPLRAAPCGQYFHFMFMAKNR